MSSVEQSVKKPRASKTTSIGDKIMTSFKFATDSEVGMIEAETFADACEKLDAMVTEQAIEEGAWGWVEDIDGNRYERAFF